MNNKNSATIQINITRKILTGGGNVLNIYGVPYALPAPLFTVTDYDTDYTNVINSFIDPTNVEYKGMSFVLSNNDPVSSLVFKFSNAGSKTIDETITVSIDGRDILGTINWLRSTSFLIKKSRVRIDNALSNEQFNQFYYIVRRSGLSISSSDFFKPSYFEPDQLPSNVIRTIDQDIPIDSERGICPMIIPYANGAPSIGASWTTNLIVEITDIKEHTKIKDDKHFAFGN
jgi:hypothetical protein